MQKFAIAGLTAALLATAATPALAQNVPDDDVVAGGAAAGGTTGAVTGFFLGGPIGAVIGGFAGATIGAAVTDTAVNYAAANPVPPIYVEGPIQPGYVFGPEVDIAVIPEDPGHGYVYANNRVYIVDLGSRAVVHSPGYTVPQETVTFIEANPTAEVVIEVELAPGAVLPEGIALEPVPNDPAYAYAYVEGRPVLVDTYSRTVVWVG